MFYQQDFSSLNKAKQKIFPELTTASVGAIEKVKEKHRAGFLPVLDLPSRRDDVQILESIARDFDFPNIFVLGTGGSSLGGKSLCDLVHSPFTHAGNRRHVHFFDNIDPHTLRNILDNHDLGKTGFVVISKSGSTAETLCQFLVILNKALAKLKIEELKKHFIVITEPKTSPLRILAEKYSVPVLEHHPGIGGRFSVLSLVGILPALLAGIDVFEVRKGAEQVYLNMLEKGAASEPASGAVYAVSMMKAGLPMMVMMPYCDRLKSFSDWYRQLWAESVGKQGQGSTPLSSLGTVDQHSQLQLFLDGPKDKAYTLLFLDYKGKGERIPPELVSESDLAYFAHKTMGDLMAAEQQATAQTLVNQGCPTRIFHLPQLDAAAMGALFMHFMLETMIAAELMEINAYDQPAVEESKVLTRQFLAEYQAL